VYVYVALCVLKGKKRKEKKGRNKKVYPLIGIEEALRLVKTLYFILLFTFRIIIFFLSDWNESLAFRLLFCVLNMLAVRGALNQVARSSGWTRNAQVVARSFLPTTASTTNKNATISFARRCMATSNQPVSRQKLSESFLSGSSSSYVEQMYESWRKDPSSVHSSWNAFFKNADAGLAPGQAFHAPPALVSNADAAAAASTLQQVSPGSECRLRIFILTNYFIISDIHQSFKF